MSAPSSRPAGRPGSSSFDRLRARRAAPRRSGGCSYITAASRSSAASCPTWPGRGPKPARHSRRSACAGPKTPRVDGDRRLDRLEPRRRRRPRDGRRGDERRRRSVDRRLRLRLLARLALADLDGLALAVDQLLALGDAAALALVLLPLLLAAEQRGHVVGGLRRLDRHCGRPVRQSAAPGCTRTCPAARDGLRPRWAGMEERDRVGADAVVRRRGRPGAARARASEVAARLRLDG